MISNNRKGLHCSFCIQRKEALDELAEWLRSIRRHKEEVEFSFLNNKRRISWVREKTILTN